MRARACLSFHLKVIAAWMTPLPHTGSHGMVIRTMFAFQMRLRPTSESPFRQIPRGPKSALSFSKQVAESQGVGQILKRHEIPVAGPRSMLPPPPHGDGIGSQAAGDLRPRQAGLLLEPHQPLGKIVRKSVGDSIVMSALARHGASLSRAWPTASLRCGEMTPFTVRPRIRSFFSFLEPRAGLRPPKVQKGPSSGAGPPVRYRDGALPPVG